MSPIPEGRTMYEVNPTSRQPMPRQPTVVVGTVKTTNFKVLLPFVVAVGLLGSGYLLYQRLQLDNGFQVTTWLIIAAPLLMTSMPVIMITKVRNGQTSTGGFRLDVADDRIFFSTGLPIGREWRKADGELVNVKGRGRRAALTVGTTEQISVPLRGFNLNEVRAACLAHGWSWKEGGGQVFEPVPAQVAAQYNIAAPLVDDQSAEPEVELVLRRSKPIPRSIKRIEANQWLSAVVPMVLVALLLWLRFQFDIDLAMHWLAIIGGVLFVVAVVGPAVRAGRASGMSVTISSTRLAVRYESLVQRVERHEVTGPGKVGRRYVRFPATTGGWGKMWVPVHNRRDEILSQLAAHGWELEHER